MMGVAQQMGILEFPYIVVYFDGQEDRNLHGPANVETAQQILAELKKGPPPQDDGNPAGEGALEAYLDPETGLLIDPLTGQYIDP